MGTFLVMKDIVNGGISHNCSTGLFGCRANGFRDRTHPTYKYGVGDGMSVSGEMVMVCVSINTFSVGPNPTSITDGSHNMMQENICRTGS